MAPKINPNNPLLKPSNEELFRLETRMQKDKPVKPPTVIREQIPQIASDTSSKSGEFQLFGTNRRNQLNQIFEQGTSIIGNTAKGIDVNNTLPRRYVLEPPRGDTVTGIRDMTAGKVRGTPPRPVGDWLIRFDTPDNRTRHPHININPKLTGAIDPHTRISPTTLRVLGGSARTLESFGRVARPVAIVTDTIRLGVAFNADGNQIGRNTQITAGSVAGGWAGAAAGGLAGAKGGALAGAAIGAFFGGVGAVPGAAIGGFVGGLAGSITGAFVGSSVGENAVRTIVDTP